MPLTVFVFLFATYSDSSDNIGLTGKKEGKTRLMNMVMQVSIMLI
jgi:hypothetical protein